MLLRLEYKYIIIKSIKKTFLNLIYYFTLFYYLLKINYSIYNIYDIYILNYLFGSLIIK